MSTTTYITALLRPVRVTLAIAGAVSLIVGIVLLIWPTRSAMVITALIAAYLILAGLVYIALSVFSKEKAGWSRVGHVFLGVVYIAAGAAAFVNLAMSVLALALFISIAVGGSWIFDGVVSLSLLSDAASRGWTVTYAIISIIAGAVILFFPLSGAVMIWWLFSAFLIAIGILQIIRAITLGAEERRYAKSVK